MNFYYCVQGYNICLIAYMKLIILNKIFSFAILFNVIYVNCVFLQWRIELEHIIDVAVGDSELWVAMLAEALKTYPSTGSLNTEIADLDEVRPIFTDLVNDLRKLVRKQAEQVLLPMECHYLNKGALVSVVSNIYIYLQ